MAQKGLDSSLKDMRSLLIANKGREVLKKVENEFAVEYAYEGINFDGTNKISLKDYKAIINGEKTNKKYTNREIKEVLNHYGAFKDLYVKFDNDQKISEELIKDLHETLTDGILQGGVYRNVNIQIAGAPKQPPHFEKIYDRMKHYMEKLNESNFSVLEKAAYAHMGLHKIHPFLDANGRLSRLIMNYVLISNDYLPISISKSNAKKYFKAVDNYRVNKSIESFTAFIEELLEKRYKKVSKALN